MDDDAARLRSALATAKASLTAGADPDADLKASAEALNAVITFVHSQGMAEEAAPLLTLLAALTNTTDGRENPMLTPRKKAGRPGRPIGFESVLAAASAAMTLMMEEQITERDAAQKVVRAFEANGLPLPATAKGAGEKWRAMADWRDKLRRRKKDHGILFIYESAKRDARRDFSERAGDHLLDAIIRQNKETA